MRALLSLSIALTGILMATSQENPQAEEFADTMTDEDLWAEIDMPLTSYFEGIQTSFVWM